MKNDNNYVLEAFDYNFIVIISQRRSNGRDKLKYAKNKPQSYWLFVKSVVTYIVAVSLYYSSCGCMIRLLTYYNRH